MGHILGLTFENRMEKVFFGENSNPFSNPHFTAVLRAVWLIPTKVPGSQPTVNHFRSSAKDEGEIGA